MCSRYFPSGASVAITPNEVPEAVVLSYTETVAPFVFNETLSRTPKEFERYNVLAVVAFFASLPSISNTLAIVSFLV